VGLAQTAKTPYGSASINDRSVASSPREVEGSSVRVLPPPAMHQFVSKNIYLAETMLSIISYHNPARTVTCGVGTAKRVLVPTERSHEIQIPLSDGNATIREHRDATRQKGHSLSKRCVLVLPVRQHRVRRDQVVGYRRPARAASQKRNGRYPESNPSKHNIVLAIGLT